MLNQLVEYILKKNKNKTKNSLCALRDALDVYGTY